MDLATGTILTVAVILRALGGAGTHGVRIPPRIREWLGAGPGATVQLTTAVIDGRRCLILSAFEPVGVGPAPKGCICAPDSPMDTTSVRVFNCPVHGR